VKKYETIHRHFDSKGSSASVFVARIGGLPVERFTENEVMKSGAFTHFGGGYGEEYSQLGPYIWSNDCINKFCKRIEEYRSITLTSLPERT